jgi:succinate dehydrogenase hydrophobic anchor subunit
MRESTLWILHIFAGVIILFLLGLHMFIMHLDSILGFFNIGYADPLSNEVVFGRSKQVFFMVTYIILLGTALYHGFYGLRNILFELDLKRGMEKILNYFLSFCALFLFLYGTYVAIFVFINPVSV